MSFEVAEFVARLLTVVCSSSRNCTEKKSSRLSSLQWDGQKTLSTLIRSSHLGPPQVSTVAHCDVSDGSF